MGQWLLSHLTSLMMWCVHIWILLGHWEQNGRDIFLPATAWCKWFHCIETLPGMCTCVCRVNFLIEYVPCLLCRLPLDGVTSWLKVVWYCLSVSVLVIRGAMIADYVYWLSGGNNRHISKIIKLYWQVRTDGLLGAHCGPAPNQKLTEWLLLKRVPTEVDQCLSITKMSVCKHQRLWPEGTLFSVV